MPIHQVHDNLYLVDLDQALDGFRKYICAWVYRRDGLSLVVDPGPASTIPVLVDRLRELGIDRIDTILLTHIHLDHAGGTGSLLKAFPVDRVICHPQGIPHLITPKKLWESSKKVLGRVAEAYGETIPVPESSLSFSNRIDLGKISVDVIETPGHATHHVCYRAGEILFIGELSSVYVPLDEGFHVRPSTPPPLQLVTWQESLLKVSALDVSLVCLGHYGCRNDVAAQFERAGRQLDFWVDTTEKHLAKRSDPMEEAVLTDLIRNDPDMQGFHALPQDIQARERYFCLNSIRGIRGYLMKK